MFLRMGTSELHTYRVQRCRSFQCELAQLRGFEIELRLRLEKARRIVMDHITIIPSQKIAKNCIRAYGCATGE
jgi:hypothetical protein